MRRRTGAVVLPAALAAALAAGCSGSTSEPGDDITDGVPVPGFVLEPTGASISPDGARVAVPCHDRLCVWGIGGSLEAEVEGDAVTAWTQDRLATVRGEDVVLVDLDDAATAESVAAARVRSLAGTPDGGEVVAVTDDAVLLLGPGRPTSIAVAGASEAALSPDGTRLAVALADAPAQVLSVPDGRVVITLGEQPSTQVAWSPDGERVAVGGADGVRLFATSSSTPVAELPEPAAADLAFQPGGSTLAVADADDAGLVLWEPTTDETTVLEGHSSPSERVLWGSAGSLYSVAPDAVLAWNLETGDLASTFDLPPMS